MSIERQYLAALELTHQMLGAAVNQDWDTLVRVEKQRAVTMEDSARTTAVLSLVEKDRVAEIIRAIEHESAEIMERVQSWQKDVGILLRMNNPT